MTFPLPVLLDVERNGALELLLVTLEGDVALVEDDGRLAPWPGELAGAELAIARHRLDIAARDRAEARRP